MVARVFVSRELPGNALQRLAQHTELEIWPHSSPPNPQQLAHAVEHCEGLLCMLTDRIDRTLLQSAPKLRVLSSCSVGVDHIDLDAIKQRGILLGHTPHVLTDATADLTMALLLSAARRLPEAEQFTRQNQWTPERQWEPELLLGRDLRGATLGLIGLGPIGQAVAQRAKGFGLNIIGWTPSGREVEHVRNVSFDELIKQADFVSLHLALAPETRHIINASCLSKMRDTAILLNTARGALIDEAALIKALQSGQIAAAALDVFEQEPISAEHPLLKLPQVVITPHIGSATWNTRCAMANLAVDNLLAGLAGERMPYPINTGIQP